MGGFMQSNPPPVVKTIGVLNENDAATIVGDSNEDITKLKHTNERRIELVWPKIIAISLFHLGAIYGIYLSFTSIKIYTFVFAVVCGYTGGIGVTAGAHRLWAHRSYKAKRPLQILLLIFHTMSLQLSIIHWVRDHRVHHKYSETDADPHNITRGFFFAHIGWLFCKKHPDVIAKGKIVDMSDLESDPMLRFQHKYYFFLMPIACFIVPTLIPIVFWDETIENAFFAVIMRWTFSAHVTFSVNSFAHMYGSRPYNRFINPVENKLLSIIALGEGWHNYHHAFPWDYKTGELGNYNSNMTKLFIDCMAKIGWAYDRKFVSPEMIERVVEHTGDGTHDTWKLCDKHENDMQKGHSLITHTHAEKKTK